MPCPNAMLGTLTQFAKRFHSARPSSIAPERLRVLGVRSLHSFLVGAPAFMRGEGALQRSGRNFDLDHAL